MLEAEAPQAVIGLEVHAQIHTRAKMFCGCPVVADADAPPNSATCPVCLGLPGALPTVNRQAVDWGIQAGLALHCTLREASRFARKSYFYPDLPKGYQISQHDAPLAENGTLEIEVNGETRRIGITRAHLEEDTAHLIHRDDGRVAVDFNRAGIPLLEIVSEPVLRTVDEVYAYATALHHLLAYLGLNRGDMSRGMMRFEANVSVREVGATRLASRVEIKNLNSFRALTRSVAYEIERQRECVRRGEPVAQETRGWDEVAELTFVQRSKETAPDYRYFPEPDIPPLVVAAEHVAALRAVLPELPRARRARWRAEHAIRRHEAALLVQERTVADYFDRAAGLAQTRGIAPQEVAQWMTGNLFALLNAGDVDIAACRVTPERLVRLLERCAEGVVSVTAARAVLEAVFETGESPDAAIARLDLAQISDAGTLSRLVRDTIAAHPAQAREYRAGKSALLGWFVGQVMAVSQGKANPQEVRALLQRTLDDAPT